MKFHALSMSKADMALAALEDPPAGCLYGFRADVARFPRPSGEAAKLGTLVHRYAEARVKTHAVQVASDLERQAWDLYSGPLSAWLDSRRWTGCELGLRYDAEADVSVVGPRRGEASYDDIGAMVLPGTLDLVEVVGDEAWVADIKTGSKTHAHAEQLYAQGVAVSRLYGVKTVHVGFAFVRKTKSPEPAWETLDEDRLDYEAGRIRKALRRLPMAEPQAGDWCWRCDAKPACPAHTPSAEFDMNQADVA